MPGTVLSSESIKTNKNMLLILLTQLSSTPLALPSISQFCSLPFLLHGQMPELRQREEDVSF